MNASVDEDGWSAQGPVTELTKEHSFEFLKRSSIGRIAVSTGGRPAIFPIDFHCDGETILFRTAPGTKLSAILANPLIAFEADEHSSRHRLSVIIDGTAHVLSADDDIRVADRAPLPRWIPVSAYTYVRIVPEKVHGRRFSSELSVGHVE